MAPELLQKGKMTRAADVYSFAMIMVELFTCKRLFEGLAQQQVQSPPSTILIYSHCLVTSMCLDSSANLDRPVPFFPAKVGQYLSPGQWEHLSAWSMGLEYLFHYLTG